MTVKEYDIREAKGAIGRLATVRNTLRQVRIFFPPPHDIPILPAKGAIGRLAMVRSTLN